MALTPEEIKIVEFGKKSGKTEDEVLGALSKYRMSQPQSDQSPSVADLATKKQEPSYAERLKDNVSTDIANRVQRVQTIRDNPDTGLISKGVQIFGQGAGLAANALEQTVGQAPIGGAFGGPTVNEALNSTIGKGVNWLATSEWSPLKKLGDVIGSSKSVQDLVKIYDTDQSFRDSVDSVANIVRLASDVKGTVDTANATQAGVQNLSTKAKRIFSPAEEISVYHGTTPENAISITQKGFDLKQVKDGATDPVAASFTTNAEEALKYANGDKTGVIESVLKGKNIAKFDTADDYITAIEQQFGDYNGSNATKFLKQYDGVVVKGAGPNGGDQVFTAYPKNISVVDPTKVKTPTIENQLSQNPVTKGQDLLSKVRTVIAEKNVDPKIKASFQRLDDMSRQGIGETKIADPVKTYDEFIGMEKNFKGDIKSDVALGAVGQRIGNSFDQVVQQRRAVGKVMGAELEKIGSEQASIASPRQSFESELQGSGLSFDSERASQIAEFDAANRSLLDIAEGQKGSLLSPTKTSKFTNQDINLLDAYTKELYSLGDNPTIAELDAFLSRIPNEIDVYKGKNSITKTTNAERIIKNNLSQLREQFSPTVTNNPKLSPYYEARKTYAELSNFLEEGESFLGKKTASGDYAKDASIAKSSVQSLLNNGKKDWLIQLEELTGYPALDESVLALQAMKDSGNFRGLSLLETLSKGDLPAINQNGIRQKVIDFGLRKGSQMLIGTPEEQTRLFLQSLKAKK